jgi:hypothetical protein
VSESRLREIRHELRARRKAQEKQREALREQRKRDQEDDQSAGDGVLFDIVPNALPTPSELLDRLSAEPAEPRPDPVAHPYEVDRKDSSTVREAHLDDQKAAPVGITPPPSSAAGSPARSLLAGAAALGLAALAARVLLSGDRPKRRLGARDNPAQPWLAKGKPSRRERVRLSPNLVKPSKGAAAAVVVGSEVPPNAAIYERMVKCGKADCPTCVDGPSHGPYLYAYWREGDRMRSKYLGKK